MAIAPVIGFAAGKRLLNTSICSSDPPEKPFHSPDTNLPGQFMSASPENIKLPRIPNFRGSVSCNWHIPSVKTAKEHAGTTVSTADSWLHGSKISDEDRSVELVSSWEVLLLLQKSMLEKQWDLSFDRAVAACPRERCNHPVVTRSGISARERRAKNKRGHSNSASVVRRKQPGQIVNAELLRRRFRGYIRSRVSEDFLSHAEVVNLSQKIKAGISLEEHRSKLKKKLGHDPSDELLASSLRICHADLHSTMIEYSLAREKLTMSNVRLVTSIAQKYDNMGTEMADLIQGGLIGLLRGIEKFDSSRGFRISTYVYWWIRQGVSRALAENSKILRLPAHLHERLSLIRKARIRLQDKGVAPSIDRIAESLNMSQKKVMNATEAVNKVFSIDREAFPSLNGLPGETLHSYIADTRHENNPWHEVDEQFLKEEVNRLLCRTLNDREKDIISLYYGLRRESYSWEDISRQISLSRERVRQVGLVALEKLKRAARSRRLDAMLVKH